MMEKDKLLTDDFIGNLIKNSPLEQPSDEFVAGVMEKIRVTPENATERKPYFFRFRPLIPYLFAAIILVFIFLTSDLPILSWLPGKGYWSNTLVPFSDILFSSFKTIFTSKYVSFGLLIGFSITLLFFIDHILSHRGSIHRHTLV